MNKLFWDKLFLDGFQSREVDVEELEEIITNAVTKECPGDEIKELKYKEDGIEVILESGDSIDVEVDWNEIIIS